MQPARPPKGLPPIRHLRDFFYSLPKGQAAFSGLEFFFWAAMAGTSLTAMYLQSKGLSADQVGRLSAFFALVGIFSPPFWGMVSDKLRSAKRVFILCLSVSAVVWLLSPLVFEWGGLMLVWIMFPLARFFFGPTNALLDSWLVRTVHNDRRMSYGAVRMFGSVGFAILAISYTYLVGRFSTDAVFPGYALCVIPVVLIALRMKDDTQSKRAVKLRDMQVGRLFKSFPYVAFLLFNVALYMPVNASITFLPYLIESIGESSSLQGMIIGLKALMEIPLLLISARLIRRFKLSHLIMVAACFYGVEMLLYPLCSNIYAILAVQCLHGMVYGLYLSAQIQYVHQLAPEDLSATAQTLSGASIALAGIVGNLMGGYMIRYLGISSFYIAAGCVQILAVVGFALSLRRQAQLAARQGPALPSDNQLER